VSRRESKATNELSNEKRDKQKFNEKIATNKN